MLSARNKPVVAHDAATIEQAQREALGGRLEERRPRLLYVITSGDTGGAQSHVLHCCERLSNEFEIALAAGSKGYLTERVQALGLPVYTVTSLAYNRPTFVDAAGVGELIRLIKTIRPNLLCCHSTKAGFLGRLAARLAGVPAVFTAHGWAFSEGVPGPRRVAALWAERVAARWARRIICVSEYDRRLALGYGVGRPEQLVTVHNGVPPVADSLRAKPGESSSVRVVMVARFSPPKDPFLLLRALAGLIDYGWELWFVGGGELEEKAKAESTRLGLGDRVRFLGARRDVAELLAHCHIFVLASNWEGLPLTVLEAMRAGLPVVASDVGGVGEAVVDGVTGFLVPRGDAGLLQERLKVLLESPELRDRMGAAGYERFRKQFTVDRMVARTKEVYYEVLSSG